MRWSAAARACGLTNVEADHLDHYGTLGALEAAFGDLVARTEGPVVVVGRRPRGGARARPRGSRRRGGDGRRADSWRVESTRARTRAASRFTLVGTDEPLESSLLAVTGRHNVADAAVAAVAARELGARVERGRGRGWPTSSALPGASSAAGVAGRRRFVDDYAHLPGEVARDAAGPARRLGSHVGVVFQPHRVTRTVALADRLRRRLRRGRPGRGHRRLPRGRAPAPGGLGRLVADRCGARVAERSAPQRPEIETLYVADLTDVPVALAERADSRPICWAPATSARSWLPCPGGWAELDAPRRSSARRRVLEHAPFGARTTYRVGGTARLCVDAVAASTTWSDSAGRCRALDVPLVAVGNGSNLLVADGEVAVWPSAGPERALGLPAAADWRDEAGAVRAHLRPAAGSTYRSRPGGSRAPASPASSGPSGCPVGRRRGRDERGRPRFGRRRHVVSARVSARGRRRSARARRSASAIARAPWVRARSCSPRRCGLARGDPADERGGDPRGRAVAPDPPARRDQRRFGLRQPARRLRGAARRGGRSQGLAARLGPVSASATPTSSRPTRAGGPTTSTRSCTGSTGSATSGNRIKSGRIRRSGSTGETSVRVRTRSGRLAAALMHTAPPIELPTRCTGPSPSASIRLVTVPASALIEYPAVVRGGGEKPEPGRSTASAPEVRREFGHEVGPVGRRTRHPVYAQHRLFIFIRNGPRCLRDV